ncbi:MAG: hypothetical protein IJI41_07035, partial [Anaerolineaceae bacterium]|nr:hypothetical protein [Anaerolineaceae bacterium]
MIAEEMIKTNEAQIIEPDVSGLQHVTDFDSYQERVREALEDYNEIKDEFKKTDPNKKAIMAAAEKCEK